jgi:Arc/MetJ-type ribon-helix-helix transcriptional regulator
MVTIHLTPQQEAIANALVETEYYKTVSEIGRAAFDKFLSELPPARKLRIAILLYAKGEATVSRVAEIADIPLHEARQVLRDEGILREGSGSPPDEMRAKAKAGASKYRK